MLKTERQTDLFTRNVYLIYDETNAQPHFRIVTDKTGKILSVENTHTGLWVVADSTEEEPETLIAKVFKHAEKVLQGSAEKFFDDNVLDTASKSAIRFLKETFPEDNLHFIGES